MSFRDERPAVAILAGGAGRRIGGDKPLQMLGGARLIDRALAAARLWSGAVFVAVRDPRQAGSPEVPFVPDAPGIAGPIAGLAAALRHAREVGHELLLTIPCDSPFLPVDLAERLRNAIVPEAGAAVAESGGALHPACALWRSRTFDALAPYLAGGRLSLRGFAEHVGFATATWPVQPIDPFFNVNSREDLAAAERLIHG